jgi:putative Holliday junction resolvase
MMKLEYVMALDVGEKRIGVAIASTIAKIAHPDRTLSNDESVWLHLQAIIDENAISKIIIGLPRNMSGEETQQSNVIRDFADDLRKHIALPVQFQDESVTSIAAEEILQKKGKPYDKADIDAQSAVLILDDYLRSNV